MPIHEFRCPNGHVTEVFYRSFKQAEGVSYIICPECPCEAGRIDSVPFPAHFLGNPDGYYKPSPTKRFNTKVVSQKTGNKCSIG